MGIPTDNDFGLRDGRPETDSRCRTALVIKTPQDGAGGDKLGGIPRRRAVAGRETYPKGASGSCDKRYNLMAARAGQSLHQGHGSATAGRWTRAAPLSTSVRTGIVRLTSPTGTIVGYSTLPIVGASQAADLGEKRGVRDADQRALRHSLRCGDRIPRLRGDAGPPREVT